MKNGDRFLRKKTSVLFLLVCLVILLNGCWVGLTDTPYYTQTTSYYCGAASAQMILNTSPKPHIYVASQDDIYNYIHSHNQCTSGWASDPKGLRDVLNHYYPDGHFIYYTPSNQLDGNKKLAYTIDKYKIPPAVLIYGSAHWVVVTGVYTDLQPTTNPSYVINAFFVHDPWYGSNSLGQYKYIEINGWNSNYFTGATWCGLTGTRYISVVDPNPVPKIKVVYPKVLARKNVIIPVKEIQTMAQQYYNDFSQQKDVAAKLKIDSSIITGSKIASPVLVNRSDRRNDAYYIVPLQMGTSTSGAMILDAYSGQFMEASFVPKAIDYSSILKLDTATKLFKSKIPNLKLPSGIIKSLNRSSQTIVQLRPDEVQITKLERVWEPSEETQNPYYPLWKVEGKVRNLKTSSVLGYMNASGKTFTSVTKVGGITLQGGGAQ